MATMNINIEGNPIVPCGADLTAGGGAGIYELILNVGTDTGWTGIKYDSLGVPDRFQIYYNNVLVSDSKFVGNNIQSPSNPTGGITYGTYTMNNYSYDGTTFVLTGTTTDVTISFTDISDNITEPTDGNGVLLFNKTTMNPTNLRIVAIGSPTAGTSWTINGVCPIATEDLVSGYEIFVYTMFSEANKALQTRSSKFVLDEDNNRFYTNKLGDTNFDNFGYTITNQYLNDGTTWWQIDATGNILSTGAL